MATMAGKGLDSWFYSCRIYLIILLSHKLKTCNKTLIKTFA